MAKRKKKKVTIKRKYLRWLLVPFIALVTLLCGVQLTGRVVIVHDGDTVSVLDGTTGTRKIRLYGIDCPESRQQGGKAATEFVQHKALLKNVTVKVMDKDTYGRDVALVMLEDGTLLNEELVKNGHAWVYGRYCSLPQCAQWKVLEAKARKAKKGLWAKRSPMAPWVWRQKSK